MEIEETDTPMAELEAFSDLSLSADPFSKLPEQLIHLILSFFRSTKEIARTGGVSKQWLRAWHTFPVSNFDLTEFTPRELLTDDQMEAHCCKFIKFVDDTLMRIGRQKSGMRRLVLSSADAIAPHLSRWINLALDYGIQDLTLNILMYKDTALPCLLPVRVFSTDYITCLILNGPSIVLPLDEIRYVNLPSLRVLCFINSAIYDNQLQKILRGCPLLDMLSLFGCESLCEVVISGSPNLKAVRMDVYTHEAKLTLIRIKAPNLETFIYKGSVFTDDRNVTIKVNHSPKLKCLELYDPSKNDKWLHEFLAKFPLLESLKIVNFKALRRIRIKNLLLHLMSIQVCINLEDVLIESKNVTLFNFIALHGSLPKPTIRMVNPSVESNGQVLAFFPYWDQMLDFNLFFKLKEFLMRSMTFGAFTFNISLSEGPSQDENVTVRAHKQFPTSAYKMERLRVGVNAPEASYPFIMNGLLSTCHPTIVILRIFDASTDHDFIKFFCEEIAKKPPHNRKSCCKGNVRCWKHQLKGVKVEGVSGVKHRGDLDLPVLINMVPTLGEDDEFRLRLKW